MATPCPLILAVPVALVAGLSRAAHFGVLIKGAKPLEALARIQTLILDKTGTLTDGRPQIVSIDTHGDLSDERGPAPSPRRSTRRRNTRSRRRSSRRPGSAALTLPVPSDVVETPGEGVAGTVDGRSGAWSAGAASLQRRSDGGCGDQARKRSGLGPRGACRRREARGPPRDGRRAAVGHGRPSRGAAAARRRAASCLRPATAAPWPRR